MASLQDKFIDKMTEEDKMARDEKRMGEFLSKLSALSPEVGVSNDETVQKAQAHEAAAHRLEENVALMARLLSEPDAQKRKERLDRIVNIARKEMDSWKS